MPKTTPKCKEISLFFTSLTAITFAMDAPEHACPITDENKLIEVLYKNSDNDYFRGPIAFTVSETKQEWLLEEVGKTNEEFTDQLSHFYDKSTMEEKSIIHVHAHFKELKFSEHLFLSSALHNYVLGIRDCGFAKKEPIRLATRWEDNKFHLLYPFPGINEQRYRSKIDNDIVARSQETVEGRAEKARLVGEALEAGFPAVEVRFTLTPLITDRNQAESKDSEHRDGGKNKKDSRWEHIDLPPLELTEKVAHNSSESEIDEADFEIIVIPKETDLEASHSIVLSDSPLQEEPQDSKSPDVKLQPEVEQHEAERQRLAQEEQQRQEAERQRLAQEEQQRQEAGQRLAREEQQRQEAERQRLAYERDVQLVLGAIATLLNKRPS
ncbi:hypothetical protein [Candidatus Odyssella thessalonicensis]|uniref:hypothetical protein n=1 Tax=Candidatus Odyssella thessalonicensis TaxID=84647 RepID=UPI000225C1CD|nr:hypothetical protein [Candidatus Odyssella thessalonicensis]